MHSPAKRRGRAGAAGVAAISAALVGAAGAHADTLGVSDLTTGAENFHTSALSHTYVQKAAGSQDVLIAPADGVIDTWQVNLFKGGTVSLIDLHPEWNGYTVKYMTPPISTDGTGVVTFPGPLPVSAGDAIGLQVSGGAQVFARPDKDGVFLTRDDTKT